MKREVLIGDKYNRLTVIKEGKHKGKKNVPYYICKCDCGNIKEVQKYHLIHGRIRSCGCLQREAVRENVKKAHIANIKHFGCMICGSDHHYAKGMCHNCYEKNRRGTLE